MPLVEVEQEELNIARNARVLLEKFHGNPKTRQTLLRMTKELNPAANIPEIDLVDPVEKKISAQAEELKALRESIAAEKASSDIDRRISEARAGLKARGWDDEGIGKIEKLMQDEGIPSYEAAEALFEKRLPKNTATTPASSAMRNTSWNTTDATGDDLFKRALQRNNFGAQKEWQDREVNKALLDFRAGKA